MFDWGQMMTAQSSDFLFLIASARNIDGIEKRSTE